MTTKRFRDDNTAGYSQTELDALNREWAERAEKLDPDSEEYQLACDAFDLEVANR
jgi:hypothetical protein